MASLWQRFKMIFGAKVSSALDKAEDPTQTLDYSYEQQLSLLQNVKRGIADVVTAKKRLQMQQATLEQSVVKLETQARAALARRARGSRAPGARAQVGRPAAAAGPRRPGAAARGPAGAARAEREGALRADRVVPVAEGSDEGAVLGGGGAGAHQRGRDGARRQDVGRRRGDRAREGEDRGDAGARGGDGRADRVRARSRTSPPTARSSTASSRRWRRSHRWTPSSRS